MRIMEICNHCLWKMPNKSSCGGHLMKRHTVLVVDDNIVNRLVLNRILKDDYNIIEAENGQVALSILRENYELISVVLLDIIMPLLDGHEVLSQIHQDEKLSNIPVIVTSGQSGEDAEVKALSLGANDFMRKPYKPEVIKHRIANMIFLRESAAFVNSVQHDQLTGVLSKEYFYIKAQELISANPAQKYDMVCCDIERFKLVNDLYGTKTGDKLLKYLAAILLKQVDNGGLCGRIGVDVFAMLIEHRCEYQDSDFLKQIQQVNQF